MIFRALIEAIEAIETMNLTYNPTHLDDFLGNADQKRRLIEFLNDIPCTYDEPSTGDDMVGTIDVSEGPASNIKIKRRKKAKKRVSSIIVLAASGMGKTTLCELLFARYDVFVVKPFYELFSCHKQLIEYLESSIRTVNILKSRQKKVIFLDDVDILFSNDRYSSCYIQSLINRINSEMLPIKVVITCSIHEERKLCDLKKTSPCVKLESPSVAECQRVVRNLLERGTNSTRFGDMTDSEYCDRNGITTLIQVMKCNLRSIISNLHLFATYEINEEKKHQRYTNLNVFEICQLILDSAHDVRVGDGNTSLPISDTSLISLILYDNLRPYIQHNYAMTTKTYLQGFIRVLKAYVFGSIIEANAYDVCSWKNVETANYIKLGAIQIFQQSQIKKNRWNERPKASRAMPIQYTTITTRASQHYSNARKMEKYASRLGMSCDNVRLMCEVAFETERQCVYRKHIKYSRFSEESIFMNNYIRNICHPQNSVFSKKMHKVYKMNGMNGNTFFLQRRIMR